MKKLIITASLLGFIFSHADAQMTTPDESYPQAGFHAGVRYQPQIIRIKSEAYDEQQLSLNTSSGSSYALSLAYFFSNRFSMQTELMYSALDQKYNDPDNYSRSISLSYINIPFLFSLSTDYGKTLNFNIALGPQIGLNTGADLKGPNDQENEVPSAVVSVKPLDLGLAYGMGIDLGIGRKKHLHLSIGLRGVKGLMPIDKANGVLAGGQYYILKNARINTIGAYLGLMFKL